MLYASCHCGAVRLEIARRPRTLTECGCSICRRYGARWAYYTQPSVHVRHAQGAISTHASRTGTFLYHFCRRCGCVTHYTRVNTANDARIAVNARMMDPEALAGVPVRRLAGRGGQSSSRNKITARKRKKHDMK